MEKVVIKKQLNTVKKRLNILWGYVGTNRTGKSVTARKHAESWKRNNEGKTIVAFDPQKRFEGLYDIKINMDDEDWCLKLLPLRNALIILDDYMLLLGDGIQLKAPKGLKTLMSFRADWNIDIIYICHNPALILNILTFFTTQYFLFYTEVMDGSFQKKIPNYKLCINGQRLINKYVKTYGRGTYPKFPHVVVDTEKVELNAYNFTQKLN